MTDSNPQIPSLSHDSGDKRGNGESDAINPTALYRHYDESGTLLYVGISVSVLMRVSQHKLNSSWFNQVVTIKIERFSDYQSAATAEQMAIKAENPKYNQTYANNRPLRIVTVDETRRRLESKRQNKEWVKKMHEEIKREIRLEKKVRE